MTKSDIEMIIRCVERARISKNLCIGFYDGDGYEQTEFIDSNLFLQALQEEMEKVVE